MNGKVRFRFTKTKRKPSILLPLASAASTSIPTYIFQKAPSPLGTFSKCVLTQETTFSRLEEVPQSQRCLDRKVPRKRRWSIFCHPSVLRALTYREEVWCIAVFLPLNRVFSSGQIILCDMQFCAHYLPPIPKTAYRTSSKHLAICTSR